MNKNTSNKITTKTSNIFTLQNPKIAENKIYNQQEIVKKNQFQKDSNEDYQELEEISPYEKAMFKKRIIWKATIFALKIVIPVVFLAIILKQFMN